MHVDGLCLPATLHLGLTLACSLLGASHAWASSASAPGSAGVQDAVAYTESGQASWYGPRHEGLRTTSGERFDSSKMTAAHASLPIGSFVRVTDTSSGRSIVVRVNDREPPHGVRCIDLSRAAATRLGFAARGVTDVDLAQISAEEARSSEARSSAEPRSFTDLRSFTDPRSSADPRSFAEQGANQEVAEAPDNAAPVAAGSAHAPAPHATAPHGRRHTHRARR